MIPLPETRTDDVFIAYLAADTDGTVYTDFTGKFLVTSSTGYKYIMVLYHYDSNGIFFRPMKNRSDTEAVWVCTDMYQYLKVQNCKPRLNIMDNKASTAVNRCISLENAKFQLVEPNNHRVNEAERAIRMLKKSLCSRPIVCTPKTPNVPGGNFLSQVFITLNLLRTSITCPKISAYIYMEIWTLTRHPWLLQESEH